MMQNPYRTVLLFLWVGAGVVGGALWFTSMNAANQGRGAAEPLLAWGVGLLTVAAAVFAMWFLLSAIIWSIEDVARRGAARSDDDTATSR